MTVGRLEKMSKSKKNVVDLDDIVDSYGADTARLYLLSDSPPERDLEWTEAGIDGAWRYVSRLWRMVSEPAVALPPVGSAMPPDLSPGLIALRRTIHKTIEAVTDDLEKFRFNRGRRAHPRIDQRARGHPGQPSPAPARCCARGSKS